MGIERLINMKIDHPGPALRCLLIVLGSAVYAAGFSLFLFPNRIVSGGVSGIAQIINYLTGLPVGTTALILNLPLFAVAWRRFGWKFVAYSLLGTAASYVLVDVFNLIDNFKTEPLLGAIYGGVLSGFGLGIVFRMNATTGGADIIVRLMRKNRPGMQIGQATLMLEVLVVAAASVVFRSYYSAMYAMITIFLMTKVIDGVLYGVDYGKQVIIISANHGEISRAITSRLGRGVTMLYAKGAYSGEEKTALLCAIKRQQIIGLRKLIREIDENAFVIVTDARDILGEGFSEND